jgi:hypothetical protein
LTSRAEKVGRDRLASDQITETPAFVDTGCHHGAQHNHEPVMGPCTSEQTPILTPSITLATADGPHHGRG